MGAMALAARLGDRGVERLPAIGADRSMGELVFSGSHDPAACGPVLNHALSALALGSPSLRRCHSPASALLGHGLWMALMYFVLPLVAHRERTGGRSLTALLLSS